MHLFVHPSYRERFTELFRDVLGCTVLERNFPEMPEPVLFIPFPDGSGFSVEFSTLAAADAAAPLDDDHAFRGAWIEFRASDVAAVNQKLRDAGVARFRHQGSAHEYFSAPGGQVFRVIALDYTGP